MNISITPGEQEVLTDFVRSSTGIELGQSKTYLLEDRFRPLLTRFGLTSFSALHQALSHETDTAVRNAVVDAICTNETYFFRDGKPFELFRNKLIPDLLGEKSDKAIKILSAACSSGQEAYSMCIALHEILADFSTCNVQITASDISSEIIARASQAQYSRFEISRGLNEAQVAKHFTFSNNSYRLNDELRSIVSFSIANLLKPQIGMDIYDIVFCRNVACYFKMETRRKLFDNLANQLKKGGCLVIGSTENIINISDRFQQEEFHGVIYYRRII